MNDQVIDAAMARAIQIDANRTHVLFAWIVLHDIPEHPGKYIARFATDRPTIYVMVAETLAGIHEQLPAGLDRSPRRPNDPPDIVEVWFSPTKN